MVRVAVRGHVVGTLSGGATVVGYRRGRVGGSGTVRCERGDGRAVVIGPLLEYGLVGAGFVFAALCFGQRVAGDFGGAASGFSYAALSLLLWAAVRLALVVPA